MFTHGIFFFFPLLFCIELEPRDHVRENVRRMRQIQRATKRRDEEKASPVKALWKSSKYDGVQSRVKETLQVGSVVNLSKKIAGFSVLSKHF